MNRQDTIRRLQAEGAMLRAAGIRALYLFGSVADDAAGEASDVDLFIDPDYDAFDFVALMRTEAQLEALLGRPVDLMTREGLHPALRASIEREAIRVV